MWVRSVLFGSGSRGPFVLDLISQGQLTVGSDAVDTDQTSMVVGDKQQLPGGVKAHVSGGRTGGQRLGQASGVVVSQSVAGNPALAVGLVNGKGPVVSNLQVGRLA